MSTSNTNVPKIEFETLIEPNHVPDSKQSSKSIRESEISGLCVGISALVYQNDSLRLTIGSMGGVGRALDIARNCYVNEIMDATILFSSIAVEYAINMDKRIKKEKITNSKGWLNLNMKTLEIANNAKLPVTNLLNSNESIKSKKKITFVHRRNQIAHGEYRGYSGTLQTDSDDAGFALCLSDYIHVPKEHALDQFKKCSAFIIPWINDNPDISNLTMEKI